MRSIAGIRADLELTQDEMAKLLGICKTTYNHKESGKKQWLANEIRKISEISGVPIQDIKF